MFGFNFDLPGKMVQLKTSWRFGDGEMQNLTPTSRCLHVAMLRADDVDQSSLFDVAMSRCCLDLFAKI